LHQNLLSDEKLALADLVSIRLYHFHLHIVAVWLTVLFRATHITATVYARLIYYVTAAVKRSVKTAAEKKRIYCNYVNYKRLKWLQISFACEKLFPVYTMP